MSNDLGPVFVKIEEYKDVLDVLDVVKSKLVEAKGTLDEIQKLKDEEDRELSAWVQNMDEIAQKVSNIDKTVFGQR